MFTRFDRIHERDRRTDRQDGQTLHVSIGRTCIALCGKKLYFYTTNNKRICMITKHIYIYYKIHNFKLNKKSCEYNINAELFIKKYR